MTEWLIEFLFDDHEAANEGLDADDDPVVCYAGWAGDTLGFAFTTKTAARFATREIAERHLTSYGPETRRCGSVFGVAAL
jgi:hypothetical protein